MLENNKTIRYQLLHTAVIVSALGYFVDVYDLLLFSIVRLDSLKDLGLSGPALMDQGIHLINMQMIGMLIGGVFWGILGDKLGRTHVLFGSIITYSLANVANGFVQSVDQYAILRFVAGIGLAGELGLGITLVAELMPKETRGYATTLIATIGVLGAVFASVIAEFFDWRTCYFIGGGLGMALLAMRVSVTESHMFDAIKQHDHVSKGNFLGLFTKSKVFLKYLRFILVGLPVWFVVGILITFCKELGPAIGLAASVDPEYAVLFCYVGLALGDLISGLTSQLLQSRLKVLKLFWVSTFISIMGYFFLLKGQSAGIFYLYCSFLGLTVGYWVIFMTATAEQFGTNIRATVTTSVPNFVRGSVVPMTLLFTYLKGQMPLESAAMTTGIIVLVLAIAAIFTMHETFGMSMEYNEEV